MMSAGKDAILKRSRSSAKMAEELNALAVTDKRLAYVAPDRLVDRPDNREVKQDVVEALVESIGKDGLAQPVLARPVQGRPGFYELVAGQHRREAYRRLAALHPEDRQWKLVPTWVRDDLSDEAARTLMWATNVIDANGDPEERGRALRELAEGAREMRERDPGLRGVRTTEIVADMIADAGGPKMTSRTIERQMRAERDARAAEGTLAPSWSEDSREVRRRIKPSSLAAIAKLGHAEQDLLHARWERADMSRIWLDEEIDILFGNAQKVAGKAVGDIEGSLRLLERAVAAGAALPEERVMGAARMFLRIAKREGAGDGAVHR